MWKKLVAVFTLHRELGVTSAEKVMVYVNYYYKNSNHYSPFHLENSGLLYFYLSMYSMSYRLQ